MLHFDDLRPGEGLGQQAVGIGGVLVDDDDLGAQGEELHEVENRPLLGGQRRVGFGVADVRADKGALFVQQAEGGLEHAAQGQHRLGAGEGHGDRQRHETAAAAEKIGLLFDHLRQRVVGEREDGPVVAEDGVAEPGQLLGRVVEQDRLVRDIGAGHDQRLGHFFHQQPVQRRVGEHEAQAVLPRRRQAEQWVVRFCLEQYDGGLGALQQFLLGRRDAAVPLDHGHGRHQGEGLVLAPLEAPQSLQRRPVSGPAGQVIAADPLDGHDLAFFQQLYRAPPADLFLRSLPLIRNCSLGPQFGQETGWAW